jgi:hypothetical protein
MLLTFNCNIKIKNNKNKNKYFGSLDLNNNQLDINEKKKENIAITTNQNN